jgi:hypothetical protein
MPRTYVRNIKTVAGSPCSAVLFSNFASSAKRGILPKRNNITNYGHRSDFFAGSAGSLIIIDIGKFQSVSRFGHLPIQNFVLRSARLTSSCDITLGEFHRKIKLLPLCG